MLVLCRRVGESIVIDHGKIVVRILQQNGSKIRIGIEAPREIAVHRGEVQQEINQWQAKNKRDDPHA